MNEIIVNTLPISILQRIEQLKWNIVITYSLNDVEFSGLLSSITYYGLDTNWQIEYLPKDIEQHINQFCICPGKVYINGKYVPVEVRFWEIEE